MSAQLEMCETCKWWDSKSRLLAVDETVGDIPGFCRRHPPSFCAMPKDDDSDDMAERICHQWIYWRHPVVQWDDFCGEWTPKERQ